MNDFPEKDNSVETSEEELSTVFSDPTEHAKASDKKKRKLLPTIIAAVLAVAILAGGTFAVVKLIPKREEETSSGGLDILPVVYEEKADVKNVLLTNEKGSFKFYPKVIKNETSSGSETIYWYLDGYSEELIDSDTVAKIVDAVLIMTGSREITQKSEKDCGLDKPIATATIIKNDGTEYSVLLGKESPDNTGEYVKRTNDGKIFLTGDDLKTKLVFDALSLAVTDPVPGITITDNLKSYADDSGQLFSFDKLTLTGTKFPERLVIVPNNDINFSDIAVYMTVEPSNRVADKVENILSFFRSGAEVMGAYSFETDAATRNKLGFNKPDLAATMELGGTKHTYYFKQQSDGGYAVWYEGAKLIAKLDATAIPFIDYTVIDYYGSWVVFESINDVSNMTIKTDNKEYSFDIVYDDTENSKEPYVITHNGEKLVASNFQKFYEYFMTLSCADYNIEKTNAKPYVTAVLTFVDESRPNLKVEFIKTGETKYQYRINGLDMGKVTASSLNRIVRLVEKVSAGEKIN